MDSIFRDDGGDNNKKKKDSGRNDGRLDDSVSSRDKEELAEETIKNAEIKSKDTSKDSEDDITVIRSGKYDFDKDDEKRDLIADLIPDEYFSRPKKRKPACFNCFFMFFLGLILILAIALIRVTKFLNQDLLSRTPVVFDKVELSEKEMLELDQKYEELRQAIIDSADEQESIDLRMELTGNQLNYVMEVIEANQPKSQYLKIRAYPDGAQARIVLSIPKSKNNYLNVFMVGKPSIDHYMFSFDDYSLRAGNIEKASYMKDTVVRSINRELEQCPQRLGYPVRVKSLKLEVSIFKLIITVNPSMIAPSPLTVPSETVEKDDDSKPEPIPTPTETKEVEPEVSENGIMEPTPTDSPLRFPLASPMHSPAPLETLEQSSPLRSPLPNEDNFEDDIFDKEDSLKIEDDLFDEQGFDDKSLSQDKQDKQDEQDKKDELHRKEEHTPILTPEDIPDVYFTH